MQDLQKQSLEWGTKLLRAEIMLKNMSATFFIFNDQNDKEGSYILLNHSQTPVEF